MTAPAVARRTRGEWREILATRVAAEGSRGPALKDWPGPEGCDFGARARELLAPAGSALDIATGDGSGFARLLPRKRGQWVATESWAHGRERSRSRLRGRAEVVAARSTELPFATARFDVILARHASVRPHEIPRLLAPGGRFWTEQLDPARRGELHRFLPRTQRDGPRLDAYRESLESNGLEIVFAGRAERRVRVSLADLATALARFTEFDLDGDLDGLLAAAEALGGPEGLELTDARFWIEARRP